MPALTPSFLWDLESNMRVITAREYDRLTSNLWWPKIMKVAPPSSSKKERVHWLLDTARIQQTGKGGNIEFEDIVAITTEVEHTNAAAGLKLKREQFEDIDGNGIDFASHWSRQMGSYASYWPQKMLAKQILANGKTYDDRPFFDLAHPVNPYNPGAGTFANVFTGAANPSTGYPGALKIDTSVTVEEAIANIAKAIAYVATLRMPNGEDPRFLRLSQIMVPPALVARAQQITNAKFIAQVAASGAGGSADIEAVVRNFGLGQPIETTELGAAYGGSDTTFYLAMEEITTSELGAFAYINREPFSVVYYGPQNDAQLARIRELQWFTEGRNSIMNGHPYLLFKCMAA